MLIAKTKKAVVISKIIGQPLNDWLKQKYLTEKLSGVEISDEIFRATKIRFSARQVQRRLKDLGLIRSLRESFNLAIKKGRKDYSHLRKPVKSAAMRKGINLKVRYHVLKRDNFRCQSCGRSAQEDLLFIDHILPIVRGGTNTLTNLQTLCRACNTGKMLLEEKHE